MKSSVLIDGTTKQNQQMKTQEPKHVQSKLTSDTSGLHSLKDDFNEMTIPTSIEPPPKCTNTIKKVIPIKRKSSLDHQKVVLLSQSASRDGFRKGGWGTGNSALVIGKGGWATTWQGRSFVPKGRTWAERLKPRHSNSK